MIITYWLCYVIDYVNMILLILLFLLMLRFSKIEPVGAPLSWTLCPFDSFVISLVSEMTRCYRLVLALPCPSSEIYCFSKELWPHTHTLINWSIDLSIPPSVHLIPWWVLLSYYGRFANLPHRLHSVLSPSITVTAFSYSEELVPHFLQYIYLYTLNPQMFRKSFQNCLPTPLWEGNLLTTVKYLFIIFCSFVWFWA